MRTDLTDSHDHQVIYGSEEAQRPATKATSVWQKMKNEPVLFFVALYNPAQVSLSRSPSDQC
jgi:hypothetical protein